jgi:hypothetical protein
VIESRRAAAFGVATVAGLFLWQLLTVHYNYGGNWTALFCIDTRTQVPPALEVEHLYTCAIPIGYDGAKFHLIAHDPWMRRGFANLIDVPAFRYRRILVPVLAWLLALGDDAWIHTAYFTVILGFAFLGVYWLALFAMRRKMHPAWGLVFALTPATLTSVDRMTADIALAALAVAFALYVEEDARWRLVLVIALAVLVRETAFPFVGGYLLFLLSRRRFADGAWVAAAMLPALGWYAFLRMHLKDVSMSWLMGWLPLAGFTHRLLHPLTYRLPPLGNVIVNAMDYVALIGVAMALTYAAVMASKRKWDAGAAAIYGLAFMVFFIKGAAIWDQVYSFGRILTPFLLLIALPQFTSRPWLAFAPIFLIDARLILEFIPQGIGIFRGILKLPGI